MTLGFKECLERGATALAAGDLERANAYHRRATVVKPDESMKVVVEHATNLLEDSRPGGDFIAKTVFAAPGGVLVRITDRKKLHAAWQALRPLAEAGWTVELRVGFPGQELNDCDRFTPPGDPTGHMPIDPLCPICSQCGRRT